MKITMRATAQMLVRNLASDLYGHPGGCLLELIKNGFVAHMPDPECWDPRLPKLEISLARNHPFTEGPALVVLDHGSGMTEPALKRYFGWLGTPLEKLIEHSNGSSKGASQKGIGRLAALALNENCLKEDIGAIDHGYYLFSRTSRSGDIRYIRVMPCDFELEDGIEVDNFVSPTSTEARFLDNIQGSFTAIVIPTPVFDSAGEIYDAIKWLLPRERDKMFSLTVNGKVVEPPVLADDVNVTSLDGRYRARLGIGNEEKDGIWLCDAETGFRVASCMKLGKFLPEPLDYPDLGGDIFAPGLLRYQNTARDTLSKEFTRKGNKEWQKLLMFLVGDVAPKAMALVQRDSLATDVVKTIGELVDMFHHRYGPPEPRERVVGPGGIRTPPVSPPGP
ncbi:MAG: ATP-binding protein [Patescibacteria group bacterium]|nr:ATP-binding protein [Patescibacteria group bacterium]MDE2116456.1 ATP-binding protein [Patescibacteria group bacterium]